MWHGTVRGGGVDPQLPEEAAEEQMEERVEQALR
jgi:hypothetical protein